MDAAQLLSHAKMCWTCIILAFSTAACVFYILMLGWHIWQGRKDRAELRRAARRFDRMGGDNE